MATSVEGSAADASCEFSYKHVYHIPSIRVSDKALSSFLNNFSIQRQVEGDKSTEQKSKSIILQPKQPTLRKLTHIHSNNVVRAIDQKDKRPPPVALETVRRRARKRVLHLKPKSATARTAISRSHDSDLSQTSVTLLRRHVSLLGRYDFALLSRSSQIPRNKHDENTLKRSFSPAPRVLRRRPSPILRRTPALQLRSGSSSAVL